MPCYNNECIEHSTKEDGYCKVFSSTTTESAHHITECDNVVLIPTIKLGLWKSNIDSTLRKVTKVSKSSIFWEAGGFKFETDKDVFLSYNTYQAANS